MKKQIEKYIEKSSVIKIYVDIEEDHDNYFGIPVLLTRSLLTFHEIDDFHFNGFMTVRLKDVVKIRRGRFEVIKQKILKSTGELKNHVIPAWLRTGSWKSLLTCLQKKGLCASVESGLIAVNVFAIGEIHALKDNAVVLNSFDAHGKWINPKHTIEYSTITGVLFGDEYSTTFNEFVKNN